MATVDCAVLSLAGFWVYASPRVAQAGSDPTGLLSPRRRPPNLAYLSCRRCTETTRLTRALNNVAPNRFEFSATGSTVFFLGSLQSGSEQELLRLDLVAGQALQPKRVLAPNWRHGTGTSKLSKEEELQRERLRSSTTGISSYSYDATRDIIFFPAAGELWRLADATKVAAESGQPQHIVRPSPGPVLDAHLCPGDPDLIAYVRNGDIWVLRASTGIESRLTFARPGDSDESSARVAAGQPSFILQEEFDRYNGYWWQPVQTAENAWYILYEEVDERKVPQVPIANFSLDSSVDQFTFPRAGQTNATTEIKVIKVPLSIGQRLEPGQSPALPAVRSLSTELRAALSWAEYNVRLGWLPDGKAIWATLLDRNQRRIALVVLPLSSFGGSSGDSKRSAAQAVMVLEEQSDIWINATGTPVFLEKSSVENARFFWTSERSGFNHIDLVHATTHAEQDSSEHVIVTTARVERTAVTQGEWMVDWESMQLHGSTVFFQGTMDTPVQMHTYAVDADASSWTSWLNGDAPVSSVKWAAPRRLTASGFSHSTALGAGGSVMIDVRSNAGTPNVTAVVRVDGDASTNQGEVFHTMPALQSYIPPKLFTFTSKHGHTVHGMMFSAAAEFEGPRPTILYVYGGPHVQIVADEYRATRFSYLCSYTQLGYNVVAFDSRGSSRRGIKFEGTARWSMGTFEIEEQVEGLEYLMAQADSRIDRQRIAVHGWSYGGYLSLQALCQRPDIFRASVAGAPVTMWELYDTGYTERYMGLPADNKEGYKAGSVIERVNNFPDEPDRLLIVHGLIDENVHFHHTAALIDALVAAGKPHRLQVYPQERHGIRNHVSRSHFQATLLHFLQTALA